MSRAPDTTEPASTWAQRGSCRTEDPELFFTESNADEAKAVCRHCPVRARCLTDALLTEGDAGPTSRYGIYGGFDPTERAGLATDFAAERARKAPAPQPPTMWRGRLLEPCGTRAAYRRHIRRGEPICRLCTEAEAQGRRDRWAQRKAGEAA